MKRIILFEILFLSVAFAPPAPCDQRSMNTVAADHWRCEIAESRIQCEDDLGNPWILPSFKQVPLAILVFKGNLFALGGKATGWFGALRRRNTVFTFLNGSWRPVGYRIEQMVATSFAVVALSLEGEIEVFTGELKPPLPPRYAPGPPDPAGPVRILVLPGGYPSSFEKTGIMGVERIELIAGPVEDVKIHFKAGYSSNLSEFSSMIRK